MSYQCVIENLYTTSRYNIASGNLHNIFKDLKKIIAKYIIFLGKLVCKLEYTFLIWSRFVLESNDYSYFHTFPIYLDILSLCIYLSR